MLYIITKYWDGCSNFGAWFLKILFFQHKKIKYEINGVALKIKQIDNIACFENSVHFLVA
jgi:hypothetical protein